MQDSFVTPFVSCETQKLVIQLNKLEMVILNLLQKRKS